ncbi:hypothetical protein E2P86_08720 [Sphingobacterium psychroaquaticum]|nr:hypothetical protein E2P86_08720 [Sphingobacterium psychroaquaticum]
MDESDRPRKPRKRRPNAEQPAATNSSICNATSPVHWKHYRKQHLS